MEINYQIMLDLLQRRRNKRDTDMLKRVSNTRYWIGRFFEVREYTKRGILLFDVGLIEREEKCNRYIVS